MLKLYHKLLITKSSYKQMIEYEDTVRRDSHIPCNALPFLVFVFYTFIFKW